MACRGFPCDSNCELCDGNKPAWIRITDPIRSTYKLKEAMKDSLVIELTIGCDHCNSSNKQTVHKVDIAKLRKIGWKAYLESIGWGITNCEKDLICTQHNKDSHDSAIAYGEASKRGEHKRWEDAPI